MVGSVRALVLGALLGAVSTALPALAADHRVEAVPGALAQLVASGAVAPGDRILLESGRHGRVEVRGARFAQPITVTAAPGAAPVLDQFVLREGQGWVVTGLTIRPDTPLNDKMLVEVRDSRDVVLERLTVASAPSAAGWTSATWTQRARTGIGASGQNITIRNNDVRIVDHGIAVDAEGALVENNEVSFFAGDGMRGFGDNSIYRGNRIHTCIGVDDNHDDGFQSWSRGANGKPGGGVIRNVIIENNEIRNGAHPLTCTLQGIGLFNGFYEDWVIRNNTVVVNHFNGIVLSGARRATVEGNTVVDAAPGKPGPPWVTIRPHKDGRPSADNIIARNVTQHKPPRVNNPQPLEGVTLIDNIWVRNPHMAGVRLP